MAATFSVTAAAAEVYLADAIKSPAYAQALAKLLKSATHLPAWTNELLEPRGNYVGTPVTHVTVEGARYELFSACKPHDCSDNRIEVMFAPKGTRAWGAIRVDGKNASYLGAPNAAQQSALKAAVQP